MRKDGLFESRQEGVGGSLYCNGEMRVPVIQQGHAVSHAHLRYLRPFPKNLGDILKNFDTVLIPELNNVNKYTLDATVDEFINKLYKLVTI